MDTRLKKEEMAALAPYEVNLQCAKAHYLRSLGRQGQELLHTIYTRVTGEVFRRTDACGHCELELMEKIADWYFATQEENARVPKMVRSEGKEKASRTKTNKTVKK